MKKQLKLVTLKVGRYPLSTLCIVLVWILSLIPFPETPFDTIELADKWTHFIMYGGTSLVMWCEYWRRHRHHRSPLAAHLPKLWLWAGIVLSLMGGLLELLQSYCTTTRNGDWLDLLADAIGALGICLLGTLLVKTLNAKHETLNSKH